jgi:predicted nucleic acid-binding protein
VDTDVIINIFKEEGLKSKISTSFILLCVKKSSTTTLLTSDLLYKEAFGVIKSKKITVSENNFLYKLLENHNIKKIIATTEQIKLAKRYGKNNWRDLLHFILAKELEADYLVSNNVIHMNLVKKIYAEKIITKIKEISIMTPAKYIRLF